MSSLATKTRILVVGGQCRNVGKTALIVDLIRAFPEVDWTAVKITPHAHESNPKNESVTSPPSSGQTVTLYEEHDPSARSDTARYLAAGAARSLLLRTEEGRLAQDIPLLQAALQTSKFAILESNAILQFLTPTLYLLALDPAQPEFKSSARSGLDQADAFVFRSPLQAAKWQDLSLQFVEKKPHFLQSFGERLPADLEVFVRKSFFQDSNTPS